MSVPGSRLANEICYKSVKCDIFRHQRYWSHLHAMKQRGVFVWASVDGLRGAELPSLPSQCKTGCSVRSARVRGGSEPILVNRKVFLHITSATSECNTPQCSGPVKAEKDVDSFRVVRIDACKRQK